MSSSLHLNLLREEERYSSSPVRLRVMLPLLVLSAAAGVALWWGLYALRIHTQMSLKGALERETAGLAPAHQALLSLRAREQELTASARQLQFYCNARIRFGETLTRLAPCVPPNVQLTELRIPPPPLTPMDPQKPLLGPTNTVEVVTLRLAGKTTGERSSEAVNALLSALRAPAFTNLIRSAEIPKGTFRQELARNPANRETLLFELMCVCAPRRFE